MSESSIPILKDHILEKLAQQLKDAENNRQNFAEKEANHGPNYDVEEDLGESLALLKWIYDRCIYDKENDPVYDLKMVTGSWLYRTKLLLDKYLGEK